MTEATSNRVSNSVSKINSLRAGVDVGGTFTDLVVLDTHSGEISTAKIPTNYDDPIASIEQGVAVVCPDNPPKALHHATTLSTNAILERNLPKGALLTTKGFRDVLDIGRIQRPEAGIYDFNVDTPQPLIPRQHRLEVTERIGADGAVITPVDIDELKRTLAQIKLNPEIKSIAVSCLFAFVNDAHEHEIAALIRDQLPSHELSLSSEVAPEIREFERTSTVVLDALLKPLLAPYLTQLETRMHQQGINDVHIMMASGGITSAHLAAAKPVTTINSGPSAGVLAAANLGRQLQLSNLITIDMGGTSLDIGVVENGAAVQKYESSIAGFPVRVPAIDVAAVAAGGGSLAVVDKLNYIQVDRESAGSTPGPACYGRGGERATITDADVLLGRLGTQLGGRGGFTLDADAALKAMTQSVCRHTGVDVQNAAASVVDIIQARMFKAIASNTLEKGLDIRQLPLIAYGGAGPTHAVELAAAMGIRRVIVPYYAGNFSAIGLLLCPQRFDASRMVLSVIDNVSTDALNAMLEELIQQLSDLTSQQESDFTTHWLAHLRYAGQSYDLAVGGRAPFSQRLSDDDRAQLISDFHSLHERRYAYRNDDEQVELVQLRVSLSAKELDYPPPVHKKHRSQPPTASRVYTTTDRQWHQAQVFHRPSLACGQVITGPALIEGDGSSALIPPDWSATVDNYLNLDITLNTP